MNKNKHIIIDVTKNIFILNLSSSNNIKQELNLTNNLQYVKVKAFNNFVVGRNVCRPLRCDKKKNTRGHQLEIISHFNEGL